MSRGSGERFLRRYRGLCCFAMKHHGLQPWLQSVAAPRLKRGGHKERWPQRGWPQRGWLQRGWLQRGWLQCAAAPRLNPGCNVPRLRGWKSLFFRELVVERAVEIRLEHPAEIVGFDLRCHLILCRAGLDRVG